MAVEQIIWATKRLLFQAYIFFCLFTVIGGYITAPLFTYCFFGDWRFWRYVKRGSRLFFYGWRFVSLLLRWENQGFMFSVPITSKPVSSPDPELVYLHLDWQEKSSCGSCNNCCTTNDVTCPIHEVNTQRCLGYNSFFWRYFNCGRFPSKPAEIHYYGCPKWQIRTEHSST